MGNDIYVANTAGALNFDGQEVVIQKGVTRVRAGHGLLKKYPQYFDPIKIHFDVEQASARPGEQRGAPAATVVATAPAPEPEPAAAPEPEPTVKPAKKTAADAAK